MRLWSIHPKYLDPQGLTALWREALLARAVLRGRTVGYRRHPQLERFRAQASPSSAINAYLKAIHAEAARRGYAFDGSKIGAVRRPVRIPVNSGQVRYEWRHLLKKLSRRSPALRPRLRGISEPALHPLFCLRAGGIEPWERFSKKLPAATARNRERVNPRPRAGKPIAG